MSSGFSGGGPDFFTAGGRSTSINTSHNTNLNPQRQFSLRSPLSRILPGPGVQIRGPDVIGKRSLAEFQQQQQQLNEQGLGFYLRNVKSRLNYQHASPVSPLPLVDLSPVPSLPPEKHSVPSPADSINPRYGFPVLQQNRLQPSTLWNRVVKNVSTGVFSPNMAGNADTNHSGPGSEVLVQESEKKMMNHRLQELEKALLGDEEEEAVSIVTNSEWSETIQNLIGPTEKPISPSPTSSSSSCSSTSASPPIPCSKQSLIDAAVAISEGKLEVAAEILTRLQLVANPRGTSEQRLTAHIVTALTSRVNSLEHPLYVSELCGKEHTLSIEKLYDRSPCFKLGFMAANLAILEATSEQGFQKIHVLDFDIGGGKQYLHLLHALGGSKSVDKQSVALKITTFSDFFSGGEEKLKLVEERLGASANELGVSFNFSVKRLNICNLSRERLGVDPDEALAVNFAFKLHRLPDESVTTENLRDELLRCVKRLSPKVVTVVEQEMNANTAPLTVRVRETCEHYGALFESLEATVSREDPDRIRIEEALGRKIGNSVACEGKDRVERCEVFGKWRARMSMAGFQPLPVSQPIAGYLRAKLNYGTRVNSGFTINQHSGNICFGWMSRILIVASAWC